MLPCGFLQPSKSEEEPKQSVVRRPRTRATSNNEGIQESESASECTDSEDEQTLCYVPAKTLGSETQIITGHLPCVQGDSIYLPVLHPTGENLPAQEPVESNPDEPAKEYLPEWKPVEGNLDESIGMEMCEDEPESHCTVPDVSVELRPEPEQFLESLNESPTRMSEMAPINSESQIEAENVITSEMRRVKNALDKDTEAEDSAAPRRSQRERHPPLKSLNIPS